MRALECEKLLICRTFSSFLQEFTCDVSLEDDKKPQPLQFSFTLYDLDGHGKITKDDIAGIVSTIYESIGKSVVVPHYGSKTINVRLTVSPDSKTRPDPTLNKTDKPVSRRRHHHKARKLISDEEECSDTSENCQMKAKEVNRLSKDCSTTTGTTTTVTTDSANETLKQHKEEKLYETIKCCNEKRDGSDQCCLIDMNSCTEMPKNNEIDLVCKECTMDPCPFDVAMQKNARKKLLRKSRSRKQKNADRENVKPRARSLSVGNENCWKENQEAPCWKSPLRRHELIEIIRESMEKNRLCFQPNR